MYSYEQPNKDLDKIFISAPRVYACVYDAAAPPTYDGRNPLSASMAPTGGDWVDIGVIEAVTLPVTKNFAHKELGRPKTRRKSVEISRVGRVEFSIAELIPESIALLCGYSAKNILKTQAATTTTATPTRTVVGVTLATGLTVGTRVCTHSVSASLIDSVNRAIIKSVDGSTLTLSGEGFPVAPGTGHYIRAYDSIEMIDLMDTIPKVSILVFFDWLNDELQQKQVAIWFPSMASTEPFVPDLKGGDNFADAKVGLEAYSTSQVRTDGTTKLVQAIMYFFD